MSIRVICRSSLTSARLKMSKIHRAHGHPQPNEADEEEIIIKTNDIPTEDIVKLPERPTWADLYCFQRMMKTLGKQKMGLNVHMLRDPDNKRASSFIRQIHNAFYAHFSIAEFMDCWNSDPHGVIDIHLPSAGSQNPPTDPPSPGSQTMQVQNYLNRKRSRGN